VFSWTAGASRMAASLILDAMRQLSTSGDDASPDPKGHVFRGARGGGLSVMALTMQMRRMEEGDVTPHGFRSAFRDWAGEVSSFPTWIAETALAHNVGDATERAYTRHPLGLFRTARGATHWMRPKKLAIK